MIDSEADTAEVLDKCFCATAGMMQVDVPVLGEDKVCLCPRDGCTTSAKDECGVEAWGLCSRGWEKLRGGAGRLLVQEGGGSCPLSLCNSWRTPTVNFTESLPGFLSPFPRLSILWALSLLLQSSC